MTRLLQGNRMAFLMYRRARVVIVIGIAILALPLVAAEFDQTVPVEGLRENPPGQHALENVRIVVAPGRTIEKGTVLINDGLIIAVGDNLEIPAGARRWDLSGKTIYPGLIDAYSTTNIPSVNSDQGNAHWSSNVQPQRQVAAHYQADESLNREYRSQGITVRLVAPDDGIIRGQSAVVTTADGSARESILKPSTALHVRLTTSRRSRNEYPGSPMGAVALARQTFYDAHWYRDAWQAFESQPGVTQPERNAALAALQAFTNDPGLVIFETINEQFLIRAELFAREFSLRSAFVGSGHEYRRLDDVCDANRPVIVPVNFPSPPNVETAEAAADASLADLMHWDLAPENPSRLQAAGLTICLTAHGLEKPSKFLEQARKAVERGLSSDDALKALTLTPAQLLGVESWVGTVEPGKLAHLVVTDGDLFKKGTKVLATWINGQRHAFDDPVELDVRGSWQVRMADESEPRTLVIHGEAKKLKADWHLPPRDDEPAEAEEESGDQSKSSDAATDEEASDSASDSDGSDPAENRDDKESDEENKEKGPEKVALKKLALSNGQFRGQFKADALGLGEGTALLTATVVVSPDGQATMLGQIRRPDGTQQALTATREAADQDKPDDEREDTDADPDAESQEDKDESAADEDPASDKSEETAPEHFAVNYPLGAFGWETPPVQHRSVVFRQATVWTCGDEGILSTADVLVENGRITQLAPEIDGVPDGTVEVDCRGMHLTPGIIDCHSHMATDGGVNEMTQAITAEVRIGDFIDARDISIYRQLAGGVTSANILHGSANPIGGQNQVIKLRWGMGPEELKFREAPAGIKFALGENVKQSNRGGGFNTRYPQSRMGVEQLIRDAFLAARQYRLRHEQWKRTRQGLPPRYDLELETLAEIQDGERWIHCHSYRQDEILALLRTLESLNIQIGSLQHILEGYKVAEALKHHGAMASSFSDWWAYKIEVIDAIPYNGALMHEAGVVVSFNSDDQELARHLNHEAAKAVKYGGVAPAEALKFVTLNPAKQLRIDEYVGSIEVGKHADIVLWSDSPLATTSRCEQTWIDGRKFFDRTADLEARPRWEAMRSTLVQRILNSGESMMRPGQTMADETSLWPRFDEFCRTRKDKVD